MNYHWFIPLTAAAGSLTLAIIVLRSGGRAPTNRVFPFLAVTLVFWNLITFVLYYVNDEGLAFSLARVFRSGALFMPPAVAHLVASFQPRQPRWVRTVLVADYGIAALLSAANSFDMLVSGLRKFSWGYYSVGTHLYDFLSIYLIVNIVLALALLARAYGTTASAHGRLQLKFWILGAGLAMPLGLTNLLPAYGIPLYPLGNLGNAAWAGIVAYAIVRHRLMDIDIVLTKGMAYAAVSLALIAPAFALALWLQRLSFGQIHSDFSFALLIMLIGVGVLFPTLRVHAESRIGRSLFREKHEYRTALSTFTRSIVRILDRDKLLRDLADTLTVTLQLDRLAIYLSDGTDDGYTVQHSIGVPPVDSDLTNDHALLISLRQRDTVVLRDEWEGSGDPTERGVAAEACRRNGWEVCIPLAMSGRLVGLIALGRKRTLQAFYAEDLELLETLAAEAAVAIENARLYEELKKSQDIIRRADRLSALGTLAAGIAHEVRNPLVSIQTFFQLAPERLHDEEFFTTFLGMTANEVKRISDLINELLSFARSPTRSLGPVNLNEVVDRVATLLEPEARKQRLVLTRTLSPNVPTVRADSDQVKQVVINLVLNSIQATQPGGVVSISTRNTQRGTVIFGQLEVRDTGCGIPKDRLDHIFNPFFTTKDKGTGLGLSIAHQIVVEHGGQISLDSQEGHGTSFFVDLPAWEQARTIEGSSSQVVDIEVPLRSLGRARKAAS